ncbi:hypothetical protein OROGR_031091 [Orobanche gracilis]
MLSIFSHTMELLKDVFPELTVVIHVAPNKHVEEYIRNAVRRWPVSAILVPGGSACMKYNSFSANSPIIPEALFQECTPSRLASLLMDLMHDESLREKQVSAAGKFLNLLVPMRRSSENSTEREQPLLVEYRPSMIAASAVLNS